MMSAIASSPRLRAAAFDFVLVLAVSLSITYSLASAFDATVGLRGCVPLAAVIEGVLLAVLFAGSASKRAAALSAAATAVLGFCVVAGSVAASPPDVEPIVEGLVNDVPGNYLVFSLIVVASPVVVYLLSRRPFGAVVLAAAAVSVCAGVQFLFRDWLYGEGGMLAFSVALVGSGALFVYQRYRADAYAASRLSAPAFGRVFAFGLAAVAASALVGCGVFFAIVRPLGLGTPVIKPFEAHIVRPVIEYSGVYDAVAVENPELFTSLVGDEDADSNQSADGGASPQEAEDEVTGGANPVMQLIRSLTTYDADSWDEGADPTSLERMRLGALLLAAALLALAAGVVGGRIAWRYRRLARMAEWPRSRRTIALYGYFCDRFRKLGMGRADAETPLEYAFARAGDMAPFSRGTGKVDFVQVTLVYQRAAFGGEEVCEQDWRMVENYYRAFFANAHRFVGTARWLRLFWVI